MYTVCLVPYIVVLCQWPTWRTVLFLIFVYSSSLHVSSNQVLIMRRVSCINATSGICHYVGDRLVCIPHGRDSSVGIATRYGLDGPRIESRWEGRFSAPVQTVSGALPASYAVGTGSFPGVKWPGRGIDHPPPSRAEFEGRVGLYLYSPSGPSWPVLGWTLPLPLPLPLPLHTFARG